MDIYEAQKAYILANAGVAALIGARLYPVFIPQDATMPAVAYQAIGGPSGIMDHNGTQNLRQIRIQYTVNASTYESAKDTAEAMRTALWGYRGLMGGGSGVQVDFVDVTADIDGYNLEAGGKQTVRLDGIYVYEV